MRVDLLNLMLADVGLLALCGDRMYWFERPQSGDVPAIVLHLVSKPVFYTTKGASSRKFARVQCNLYAAGDLEFVALSEAFEAAVSGYKGTVGTTVFNGIFIDGWRENIDPGKSDAEKLFRVSIDLRVWYKEL